MQLASREMRDAALSLHNVLQLVQSRLQSDKDADWFYKDVDGNVQGPFSASQMKQWSEQVSCPLFLVFLPTRCMLRILTLTKNVDCVNAGIPGWKATSQEGAQWRYMELLGEYWERQDFVRKDWNSAYP